MSAKPHGNIRLGIDTGGTFTDIVLVGDDGRIAVKKVDNASSNVGDDILNGSLDLLQQAELPPSGVSQVVHCTTVLGNAVIQRRGPKTALMTTAGFRDVLELRRQRNPILYAVFWEKPAPLVPRRLCREVTERIGADGEIVTVLDLAEARSVLADLVRQDVVSVAVCLINACVNPVHEQAIAKLAREEFPDLVISLSSHVSPEWSEYERTSTTVTNAYVKPILRDYVGTLRRELRQRGVTAALDIMQSSGGVMPADAAVEKAAFCLDSGPAAGVMATCALGSYLGIKNAVTFEMGGTTTKSTIIEDGRAHRVNETEIGTPISVGGRTLAGAGYTLRIPIIDTAEVGAGGGSIAAIDTGGSLGVGPEGAGALPGPVCYGRGGTRVTLTDANLLLGYLNENHPLGGKLRLDRAAAAKLFDSQIARPLRLSLKEAAYAVRTVANATMARAIRAVSTERGRDVRKFVLFASGGGGPGHAAEVARLIGIRTVIVPPIPGLFSALGLLWSPLEYHVSQAAKVPLHANDARARLLALFRAVTERARADAAGADRGKDGIGLSYMTDLHYLGQFHELTVPVAGDIASKGLIERLRGAFEKEHARTYGYHSPEELVEVTNVRAVARPKSEGHAHRASPDGLKTLMADLYKPRSTRETWRIYFGPGFGECDVPVLSRGNLKRTAISGPLVLPEYDTTVIVPPDFRVRREATGSVVLERKR